MVYLTGDIHGETKRFSKKNFPEQENMTRDDYVIILGDFGIIWSQSEDKEEKYYLDILENKSFTTLFIDGNHENHDRLNSYPAVEWHGGLVHKIRSNVYHLMRAQIYDIEGKSFFTFGGARSHDINGLASKDELKVDYTAGILKRDAPDFEEKKKLCRKRDLFYRIEGESWWRREMPSQDEMQAGLLTLERAGLRVDYVLTHEAPTSTLMELADGVFPPDELTDYLEGIKQRLSYTEWYFGHHHDDIAVNDKDIMLYHRMHRLL